MIIVRFTSGLGNQMFQYSLYSLLRERFPDTKVLADVTWFNSNQEHQGYELERIFGRPENENFVLKRASLSEILHVTGRIPCTIGGEKGEKWQEILRYPNRLIRLFAGNHFVGKTIEQSGFEDNQFIYEKINHIDPDSDWYITGYFIEEIYYRDRLPALRRAFTFDSDFGEKNAKIAEQIHNTESVSIHVRRGDYLSSQYADSFLSLGETYYKNAVSYFTGKLKEPVFFLFSDDPDYIKEAFSWLSPKVIVMGNSGEDSYRDLQLMSLCKHNIIANSTFSVWAGLLNANKNANIIYPAAYMREKDSEVKTIQGWIRMES